jgi:hypothetical protein
LDVLLKISDHCHHKNIPFIYADVKGNIDILKLYVHYNYRKGAFCWSFCDFGTGFEVFDKNGEENIEVMIGNITKV